MDLILLNSQSNQQIPLDKENPLIIGRKNVVGCFDKKVSRSHGRITCTENGKITLAALHSNPCFFMKNGVPPVCQLNKDEEETLNKGDCLGLLPNSFWFQVVSSSDVKIKKEPEDGDNDSCKHSENDKDNKASTGNIQNTEFSRTGSSDYSRRIGSPEFEKTKKLPLWMYETDEINESGKCSNVVDNDTKTKRLKLDTDCSSSKVDVKYQCDDADDIKNREEPSTSKICLDETLAVCAKTPTETNPAENKGSVADTEPDKTIKRPICQYEHDCFRKNPQHKIEFCHPGDSDYIPYEERPLCQYGKACYRRNERHKAEFRHVSTSSPTSSVGSPSPRPPSSVGEERPPCFGGSRCLNRNPQHRKDLYHPPKGYNCQFEFDDSSSCSSEDFEIYEDYLAKEYDSDFASSPLPPKRRRKKVKRDSEYEDEDEYDLEDPFINDASSDEYVPSDLNSEEDLDLSQEI